MTRDHQGNVIRISLTLPALERLIGNDNELEVALRHQIVENFTKHHLTGIANSETVKAATEALRQTIATEVAAQVGRLVGQWRPKAELTEQVRSLIKDVVERTVEVEVNRVIREHIDRMATKWPLHIEARVASALNHEIDQRVRAEVERRLSLAANMKG